MSCTVIDPVDINYCFGINNQNIDDIIDYWKENNCEQSLENSLNNSIVTDGGEQKFLYNPLSLNNVNSLVNNLFTLYLNKYQITDDISSNLYNPFQNVLINLCRNKTLPSACKIFLDNYCDTFNENDLINSIPNNNLCGCYIQNDICNPLCANPNVSQLSNTQTGELTTCSPNVCIINNISIDTFNSRGNLNANFVNICPSCRGDNCVCVITSTNINQLASDIGISETFNNFCGTESRCVTQDNNGNIISDIPCSQYNFTPNSNNNFSFINSLFSVNYRTIIYWSIILFILFIFIIIIWIISKII